MQTNRKTVQFRSAVEEKNSQWCDQLQVSVFVNDIWMSQEAAVHLKQGRGEAWLAYLGCPTFVPAAPCPRRGSQLAICPLSVHRNVLSPVCASPALLISLSKENWRNWLEWGWSQRVCTTDVMPGDSFPFLLYCSCCCCCCSNNSLLSHWVSSWPHSPSKIKKKPRSVLLSFFFFFF